MPVHTHVGCLGQVDYENTKITTTTDGKTANHIYWDKEARPREASPAA